MAERGRTPNPTATAPGPLRQSRRRGTTGRARGWGRGPSGKFGNGLSVDSAVTIAVSA